MFALLFGVIAWLTPGNLPAQSLQQPAAPPAPTALRPGTTLEQNVTGAEPHTYTVTLDQNDCLHLVVEQQGVDITLKLLAPDGSLALEQNTLNSPEGAEELLWVASTGGVYRLVVVPAAKDQTRGRYVLRVLARRPATDDDRKQAESIQKAEALLIKVKQLRQDKKYDEALKLAREALAFREAVYGSEHPFVAAALFTMAAISYDQTNYTQSTAMYRRVLAMLEKSFGPEASSLENVLNNLGLSLQRQGYFAEAEACYQRSLTLGEQAHSPTDADIIPTINNLASLYHERGQYPAAERFYQRAIAMWTAAEGPDSPNLAYALNNLGALQRQQGNLSSAEGHFERALNIFEKALGADHPNVAILLNNLAETLRERGDHDRAEPLYQRGVAILEAKIGGNSPNVASLLTNLGLVSMQRRDYPTAETTFRRALAIYESTLGNQHPLYATCLTNLAETFRLQGRFGEAETLYRQAGAIFEKSLGSAHPAFAKTLMSQGWVRGQQKDYAAADQLLHHALRIQTEAYGPNHPDIIQTLNNLAILTRQQNQPRQSLAFQTQANAAREQLLTINLVTGSERQKFLYLKLADEETNRTLTLHLHNLPQDRDAARAALTVLLQRKGRALDAMTDVLALLRKQGNPEDLRRLDELTALKGQIAVLTQRGPGRAKPDAHRAELKALQEQAETLEAELSRRSTQYRARFAPVTLEAVRKAIPSDAALLEYAVYSPVDLSTGQLQPTRCAVYVLKADGTLHWADLGETAPIDAAIRHLRQALSTPTTPPTTVRRAGARLAAQVIAPIAPALTGVRHLLLSPDGQLNLIPFEALPGRRGQYMLEQFAITYLTSGRDLLALQENREASPHPPVVFAAPDYGSGAQLSLAGNTFPALHPLDGTEDEARTLQRLFPDAVVQTHTTATGDHLLTVNRPRFLHLATHGVFLEAVPQTARTTPDDLTTRAIGLPQPLNPDQVRRDSPLLRAYLFFAGANQAAPKSALTALEAAQLNLWGTRLVVLSACQTGVGDVRNGEGVYGLRRAFVLTGAQTQVMSMWSVSDLATQMLMQDFYARLKRGEPRGEALRQARLQLRRQARCAHPFYWAGFILTGDWRAM
ncbi:CHAT domain-containing protein [Chloracidobacterium sp. MS 40/45]|uniref:CHAT domain-containing tetratricopeptide repeat protein n=1 Tax=Chloracidobacterium aggregatum TaxID=2851959 RepID=UPI001B8AF6D1|nr:CHAT domain-containing tetratricopeptide repeat protein [Chloracidobacterium aggregatum]QUV98977.1 CHAT domain-containing protein [Chloracidobacterium sp. MS 40/45]